MGRGDRTYEIVLWGASGFTGALVAEYLVRNHPGVGLALAGRNQGKLETVRRELAAIDPKAGDLPILIGDSFDRASLDVITSQTRVVISTVGPYAQYGEAMVASCVANGTDYCDLTGETQFIRRMIDAHQADAERTGARIVLCCGFDSIPSDLGTLMVQEAAKERFGAPLAEVKFFAGESKGTASGGTIASMLNILEEAKDKKVRRILGDPYALNPEGERDGPDGSDRMGIRFDDDLRMWVGPFVMAAINTRVVRRSNALMGYPYGRKFRYSEEMSFGAGPRGAIRAGTVAAAVGAFVTGASIKPIRTVLQKTVLPDPGEGPSREQREAGFFVVRLVGKTADGQEIRGRVEGQNDPGYGETAKMLGESALCLARDDIAAPGGIRTPASTMGVTLIERLRDAGMVFRVS